MFYVSESSILEVEGDYTRKVHKNERVKIGAGESGGNLESEIKGNYSYNINGAVKGRVGKDQDVTIFGNEQRTIEGYFRHSVTDAITQKSTTSSISWEAFTDISQTSVTGITSMKAGSSLNMKTAVDMTLHAETSMLETVGTTKVSTTGGTWNHTSGADITIVGGPNIHLNP